MCIRLLLSCGILEDRFNKEFLYPYVFLNEEPFSEEFKECVRLYGNKTGSILTPSRRITALTDSKVEFGLISKDQWLQPSWINEEKASAARQDMIDHNVIYGGECHEVTVPRMKLKDRTGSVPYRNMCRYNSGVSALVANVWDAWYSPMNSSSTDIPCSINTSTTGVLSEWHPVPKILVRPDPTQARCHVLL